MEASFIAGLSMCNQHTSILFIAVIGGWMLFSLLRDKVCCDVKETYCLMISLFLLRLMTLMSDVANGARFGARFGTDFLSVSVNT